MNRRKGFTLIELLVVISIIALLLAILMPALGKVKEKARGVACAAHLKQFGLAWYFYSQENDDSNVWYAPSGMWSQGHFWFYRLAPYLGGTEKFSEGQGDLSSREGAIKIMVCPSARPWSPKYSNFGYGSSDTAWKWGETQGGYTINVWMQENVNSPNDSRYYRKYGKAKGGVPMLSDGGFVDAWPSTSNFVELSNLTDLQGSGIPDGDGYPLHPNTASRIALSRHGRAVNIVFQDTHVERVPLEELGRYKWHIGFETIQDLDLPSK
ncbi:MAG: prepilin-type N-terminal cleavage/methylation domain-containing protein [Anaerohalosphaera sp.]|nr:prepilin-type N-terminal cleavage/methylation domain-containing protein [Anaerohalosphaera sp.]